MWQLSTSLIIFLSEISTIIPRAGNCYVSLCFHRVFGVKLHVAWLSFLDWLNISQTTFNMVLESVKWWHKWREGFMSACFREDRHPFVLFHADSHSPQAGAGGMSNRWHLQMAEGMPVWQADKRLKESRLSVGSVLWLVLVGQRSPGWRRGPRWELLMASEGGMFF